MQDKIGKKSYCLYSTFSALCLEDPAVLKTRIPGMSAAAATHVRFEILLDISKQSGFSSREEVESFQKSGLDAFKADAAAGISFTQPFSDSPFCVQLFGLQYCRRLEQSIRVVGCIRIRLRRRAWSVLFLLAIEKQARHYNLMNLTRRKKDYLKIW